MNRAEYIHPLAWVSAPFADRAGFIAQNPLGAYAVLPASGERGCVFAPYPARTGGIRP